MEINSQIIIRTCKVVPNNYFTILFHATSKQEVAFPFLFLCSKDFGSWLFHYLTTRSLTLALHFGQFPSARPSVPKSVSSAHPLRNIFKIRTGNLPKIRRGRPILINECRLNYAVYNGLGNLKQTYTGLVFNLNI